MKVQCVFLCKHFYPPEKVKLDLQGHIGYHLQKRWPFYRRHVFGNLTHEGANDTYFACGQQEPLWYAVGEPLPVLPEREPRLR